MFIRGLQKKIASLVSVKDSEILDEAISAAKKIEAKSYYKNVTIERKKKDDDKWEGNMNELVQQIQNITTNYAKLTALLTIQTEVNKSYSRPLIRANVRKVKANYNSIDDSYNNEEEKKIFVTGERYHSYSCRNYDHLPNSKLQWEDQLRSRNNVNNQPRETKKTYSLIDDENLIQYNDDTLFTRALKRKRGLSIIDSLAPYNMANNILTKPASATVRQMLQYLTQYKNLAKTLRRPSIMEKTDYVDAIDKTLLLGNNWFERAHAYIHFNEQKLILRYLRRVIKMPISNNGSKKLHQPDEQLIYEDEEIEETKGYFTEELISEEDSELYSNL
ncbi:3767_t:CDS:2 [Cetraspora pellucida]|uniref:3767_t:CDS:1 n=1 Tax=Cetraspora pellucida TaxID=1433469 RepID=A0A9N9FMC4_9GLOM|nr:3767_t:CDS:2 [Cetraspora pellucida]